MLFQIYGDGAGWQLLGWVLVFAGLVLANEFARRTKIGGLICFGAIPALYSDGFMDAAVRPTSANPTMQGVIAVIALAANVICLAAIIKRAKQQKKNPYKNEIFTDQKDYKEAMARAEV